MFDPCVVCLQGGVDIILTVTGTYLVFVLVCLLGGVGIILTVTGTYLAFVLCVFRESGYHYCQRDVAGPRVVCLLVHQNMQPDMLIIALQRNTPPLHSAHQ